MPAMLIVPTTSAPNPLDLALFNKIIFLSQATKNTNQIVVNFCGKVNHCLMGRAIYEIISRFSRVLVRTYLKKQGENDDSKK